MNSARPCPSESLPKSSAVAASRIECPHILSLFAQCGQDRMLTFFWPAGAELRCANTVDGDQ